jgi:hypothetical protein
MSIYRLKGTSGPLINLTFPLGVKLTIGRADDCDIRIDRDGIAAHHAEVVLAEDGRVILRQIDSSAVTRLNGELVSETALCGGDEIQVGNCRLMLQAPGLRPDRVLDGDATRAPARRWPWLLAALLIAVGFLAWKYGYLEPLLGLLS